MRWHQDSKLTINVSRKKWVEGESNGVELGWEGSTDGDTDLDKAYAEKYDELDALAESFLDSNPTDVASELGAEVYAQDTGADVNTTHPGLPKPPGEEKPPLPGESQTQTLEGDASLPSTPKEVRTPIGENGDELEEIVVDYFIVLIKKDGEKYAKAYNKKYHKFGVTVWREVMKESSIGDVQEYDVGQRLEPSGGPLIGLGEKAEDSQYAGKIVSWK
jgi:hypothetical protein